jgi:2-keto-3-deoxy-L-rhamnonate aldolase RhmA
MGIPGEFHHPDFLAALKRILAACAAHGKTPAILATDDASAREFAARGFRLMAYGIDQLMLQDALRRGIDTLRSAIALAGRLS